MANFSINQVRHLYVVNKASQATALVKSVAEQEVGTLLVFPAEDAKVKDTLWFQYMSPAGIVRSDLITVDNIMYAKATGSDALAHKLSRVLLTLDADVNAAPVAGQEYITRIAFRQYIGLGEEDMNFKYGFVKATPNMSASDFYKKMAVSVVNNVAKDTTPLITVYLKTAEGEELVTADTKESALAGTYTGIIFEEAVQAWELGTMSQEYIQFVVNPTSIIVEGEEYIWGKVDSQTATNKVENGHNIADLEHFCMGARGDDYRMMGYPNIVKTTYLVDPTAKYDTLDIHYAFTDSNESVQKSEKDITIVCVNDGSHTAMKALISAINALLPTSKQIAALA